MKVLVSEDDIFIRENLKESLESFGYEVVGLAESGKQAISLAGRTTPDLVLMDIELKGKMSGVEAAAEIWGKFGIPVIFLTSFSKEDIVEKALEAQPIGYLLKPFREEALKTTIEVSMNRFNLEKQPRQGRGGPDSGLVPEGIFIKQGVVSQKILYKDILWIQAVKDYVKIKTVKNSFFHRSSIKMILEKLDPNLFIRVHKSYVIPINRIDSLEENTIVMGKQLIPIGRTYRVNLMKRLHFI